MYFSSEVIDFYSKVESVIAPTTHARRFWKRDKENAKGTPIDEMRGKFAHYTSADAALNIIRTKRLWMRSTTCMVDYAEVIRGHKILCDLLAEYDGKCRVAFLRACDVVHPGAAQAALNKFDALWNNNHMRLRMYISSVCEHDNDVDVPNGRLSMWRAIGKSPKVALVFSVPWNSDATNALGVFFNPVAYFSPAEFIVDFETAISNISREVATLKHMAAGDFEGLIFQMLLAYTTCTKQEGFVEEREWRAVFVPDIGRPHALEREVLALDGVPQTIFKMPFDASSLANAPEIDIATCLELVIIGPSQYSWVQFEAFKLELEKIGCKAEVISSPLPIRG